MTEVVASLRAMFGADTSGFDAGIARVKSGMQGMSQSVSGGLNNMGSQMTRAGMALAPFAAGFSAIGYKSLDAAMDFDSAMAEISARTGLVGDDLKLISDLSLQMGADTVFSAGQAAEAFLQLLSSGQTAEQAIATLPTVLDLAAASGEDLGFTADALTDIMAAFNLEITDSTLVADALAQAAGASSADIASLTAGFANVGPVARMFGLDVEKTSAILAILSENGIKGAEAGTALKSMLMNMTRDTEDVQGAWNSLGTSFYDAEGNARPLEQVLIDIRSGMEGMPVEEQNQLLQALAGSYGIVALQALMGDLSIGDMTAAMEGQASTADVAAARMDTFAGSVDSVKGSIETLQIQALTPFMNNTLKPFLDEHVIPTINAMAEWAEQNPETASTILAVGAGVIGLSAGLLILGPIIGLAGGAVGLLTGALGLLFGPLLIVTLPLALGAGLIYLYATNTWGFKDAIDSILPGLRELYSNLDDIARATTSPFFLEVLGKWAGAKLGFGDSGGATPDYLPSGIVTPPPGSQLGAIDMDTGQVIPSINTTWDPNAVGDFVGSYSGNQPVLVGTGAQPELFMPGQGGMHYPAGSYEGWGDASPIYLTVQLDRSTLYEGVVSEGRRRNVTVVAG